MTKECMLSSDFSYNFGINTTHSFVESRILKKYVIYYSTNEKKVFNGIYPFWTIYRNYRFQYVYFINTIILIFMT